MNKIMDINQTESVRMPQSGYNALSIIGLVVAVLSFAAFLGVSMLLGMILGIIGFILGAKSLNQIKQASGKGRAFAMGAVIISAISIGAGAVPVLLRLILRI